MTGRSVLSSRWVAALLALLFVPLALRAWSSISRRKGESGDAAPPAAVHAAERPAELPAPSGPSPEERALLEAQDERRRLPIERDPFRAVGEASEPAAVASPPDLRLEAVSIRAGRELAVIEDGVFAVGDAIRGYVIESISRESVVLRSGGQRFVLELEPDAGRSPR
jgi:hypothetical protein